MNTPEHRSVADAEGPWSGTNFQSGLMERCERYWFTPIGRVPVAALATYLRQRLALPLTIPEARRRIEAGLSEDEELYDGELAAALEQASRVWEPGGGLLVDGVMREALRAKPHR